VTQGRTGRDHQDVGEDYPAGPEIQQPVPELISWHSSETSTLETDVYVLGYALLVVHATQEEYEVTPHAKTDGHEKCCGNV